MTVTLSFDVEEFDFPIERGRQIDFDTQLAVSSEGLEAILGMLARLGVRATFYTTANFAQHRADTIRRIADAGHEIASHDFYHDQASGPDPVGSKRTLEEIIGAPVVGYRAPRLGTVATEALLAAGYKYNSSINPTWIPGRYNNLGVPRKVWEEGGLMIYPTSVSFPFRIPLFWISLHVMPLALYLTLARSALRRDRHLNLYFHPWEFSDRLKDPHFGVPGYIARCSGSCLLAKLEKVLSHLIADKCEFTTSREYLGHHE